MKTPHLVFAFYGLFIIALVGCQVLQPTPDVQATIDASVKATLAAQPTPTPVKAATSAPATKAPAATPVPTVNAVTLTEEELAALIDQAVAEAIAATNTTTTQTATYAADGTLTPQEIAALQAVLGMSQTEIAQALALMQAYYDLYAEIATETLNLLKAIEQDLNAMAQSLNQINALLAQGQTLTATTVTQVQTYATKANQAAASAQGKAKTLNATLQSELTKRANAALATKPTSAPTDLRGTVQSVNTYIETVRAALTDNKINKSELQAISVAGANAVAGLNQFAGTQGQTLANAINTMTKQIARGEIPKAKSGLGALEQSARSLPTVPQPPRK